MISKYNIALKLYSIFLLFLIAGCKKFVEIPPPVDMLVTASVFSSDATATAAQTSIYAQMVNASESYNMAWSNGLVADELTNHSSLIFDIQLYSNSLTASGGQIFGPWQNAYNYIYQANAIIEGLEKYKGASSQAKQQLIGESKFIRAFWNFYLANIYGDIPLVLSADYSLNATISRSPKSAVYNQVVADLSEAVQLLNSNFVDESDTTVTKERVRPTKWAAEALLARAYLYSGNSWDSAEAKATAVINNTSLFSLVPSLDSVFLINSTEAIWQLATPLPVANGATLDGYFFILVSQPQDGNFNSSTISPQLLNSFELGDNRRTHWISSFITQSAPVDTFYFPYKYKDYISTDISEYTMVLRLAEQYLIRAEARAQQGNINGALADLNTIRNRAGLPNYSGLTDQTSLITAILHERQVELFTEWGHRWFDLIRTGNANSVMGTPGNVCNFKGGSWSPNWQLYPIPQSERQLDINLTQNAGY